MIEGVQLIPKKKIHDERGAVFHMLRRDDSEFIEFGEIYFSQVKPIVIKGWHLHKKMTLNYLLILGEVKVVLFDDRPQSQTKGEYQSFQFSENDIENKLLVIPPGIWNAFQGLGPTSSLIANCATHSYSEDEIVRRDPHDPFFNYSWETSSMARPF